MTPPGPEFNYLPPHGEMIYKKGRDFDVLFLEIGAEGRNVARVRSWLNFEKSRRLDIFRTGFPSINCSASSSDCSDS